MNQLFYPIIFLLGMQTAGYAQTYDFKWAKHAGGSGADVGYSIAVDDNGNSYVTGTFQVTATFGGTTLTSSGFEDIFIAKLDSNGNYLWVKKAGGSSADYGVSIAIDSSGNSYITGNFSGNATFGNTTLTSSGGKDLFIAKLDADGNYLWAKKTGAGGNDVGIGIAVDSIGNSYLTGSFEGTLTFGTITLISAGSKDIFIAKLDSTGNYLWAKSAGGSSDNEFGSGIAIDENGNSYTIGYFQGNANFGSTTLTSEGAQDIFITKLDASGNFQWAKRAGGLNYDNGINIAVDGSGNSYVTGYFYGTATFGGSTLTSAGFEDIFIAKLDANGNFQWIKKAGGSSDDKGQSIAVDASGNSYVTGYFYGTATFGSTTLTSAGTYDIFIAKLDASGNYLWVKQAGGVSNDQGFSIAIDSSGNSYVTGHFAITTIFRNDTLTSVGSVDIFITKLSNIFPLPLQLIDFSARKEQNKVLLHWNTATESNLSHFEIERSNDGSHFIIIGRVKATGNAVTDRQYDYTDHLPIDGSNFYRLKMVDEDGKYNYSTIAKVTIKASGEWTLSPNPAVNFITLANSQKLTGRTDVNIYTTTGKLVGKYQFESGGSTFRIDVSQLASGTYYSDISNGEGRQVLPFVVSK